MNFPPISCAPPKLNANLEPPDELGKERELRQLRARCAELEKQSSLRGDRIIPATREIDRDREPHRPMTCGYHAQVSVSMQTPRVECSVCEAPMDPIEVLRDFVREERKFTHELEHLREEKVALTQIVGALKKERLSLRSQVRKKGGADPDRIEHAIRWPAKTKP